MKFLVLIKGAPMYNKLFTKILDSTVWLESTPTRIVWITFLAMMDEDGFVALTAPANVAHRSRVTLDEAQDAIRRLEAPDPDSLDQFEGRRVERVPGGWIVLKAPEYREMVSRIETRRLTKERAQRFRDRHKPVTPSNGASRTVTHHNEIVTQSDQSRSDHKKDQDHRTDVRPSHKVLVKLAHQAINATAPPYQLSDLSEATKTLAARAHLTYTGRDIAKAVDAALHQKAKP